MASPHQQKLKIAGPTVITANRLSDGVPVFRRTDGSWSRDIAEALVSADADTVQSALAAAKAEGLAVVGAYAAAVRIEPGSRPAPASERERRRISGGPSFPLSSVA